MNNFRPVAGLTGNVRIHRDVTPVDAGEGGFPRVYTAGSWMADFNYLDRKGRTIQVVGCRVDKYAVDDTNKNIKVRGFDDKGRKTLWKLTIKEKYDRIKDK